MLKITKNSNMDNMYDDIWKKCYELNQPLFATLHNHQCGNKCNHCYVKYLLQDKKFNAGKNIFNNDLEFENLLKELKNNGILELLFSGGEPLLIKNFKKKFLIARNMGFSIDIISSGYCWDESLINFIKLNGAGITLSFSASQSGLHDKIVGRKGNFNKLCNLFFKLKAKSIPIKINFLITRYNYLEITNFYELFKKYNVKISFSYKIAPFVGKPADIQDFYLNKQQFFYVIKQLDKVYKESYTQELLIDMCNAGRLSFAVDETGIIWPCVMLRIKAGNLLENKFSEIWETSEILLKIRNMSLNDFSSEECSECTDICIGNNYIANNNIYKRDEYSDRLAKWLKEYKDLYVEQSKRGQNEKF